MTRMSHRVILVESSSICPMCNGNSCGSCKQGEVAVIDWECQACGASGDGVPACCDNCGCDDVETSACDGGYEPDPYDFEPCDDGTGLYY